MIQKFFSNPNNSMILQDWPASSKAEPLLAKAEPASNGGSTSVKTCL